MNILVIGNGAREHALVWKLTQTPGVQVYNYGPTINPGIQALVSGVEIGEVTNVPSVIGAAQDRAIDIAWIGPEAPLAIGMVDALEGLGISCIGPTKLLAQLESSKSFTRNLLDKHNINVSPAYQVFTSMNNIVDFMNALHGEIVVKPDGLTGGKGVKIMGDHFQTVDEALAYCQELFNQGDAQVVVEEKLVGQEFSLMSFVDGKHLAHMPIIQDHKRVGVNDQGPNTGGMGSYTMPDHSLPFITQHDIEQAQHVSELVVAAMAQEFNVEYKGILYGGFMAVRNGVKLIEYNARFGDPEAMNLLSLLETDFVEITNAIVNRTLNDLNVTFKQQASVCKYAVPEGYPDNPVKDQLIDVSGVDTNNVHLFLGSVDQTNAGLMEKGSRAAAVVGVADTLEEAERKAETEISKITGPVFHREDIGTQDLLQRRINMMEELRK